MSPEAIGWAVATFLILAGVTGIWLLLRAPQDNRTGAPKVRPYGSQHPDTDHPHRGEVVWTTARSQTGEWAKVYVPGPGALSVQFEDGAVQSTTPAKVWRLEWVGDSVLGDRS